MMARWVYVVGSKVVSMTRWVCVMVCVSEVMAVDYNQQTGGVRIGKGFQQVEV